MEAGVLAAGWEMQVLRLRAAHFAQDDKKSGMTAQNELCPFSQEITKRGRAML
jgi:hypothetical protein